MRTNKSLQSMVTVIKRIKQWNEIEGHHVWGQVGKAT